MLRVLCVLCVLVPVLICAACADGEDALLMICGFDETQTPWRSKFDAHEVVEVERDGEATRVLRMPFNLAEGPGYDWVRAMVEDGVDVSGYRYLTVRVWADGNGERLTPALIRRVERSSERPHGEIVAGAGRRAVALEGEPRWRTLSVPLEAFDGLEEIAEAIHEVNFSLNMRGGEPGPGVLMLDEIALSSEPVGEVVTEAVRFPPADIAIADEAEFFALLDLEREELAEVRAAVEAGDFEAAKSAWAEHLRGRTTPRWTWSRRDRERIMELWEEHYGGMERYVPGAQRVLDREFTFLAVHKQLDHDPEWLHGPIEWTHVLSRHGYWPTLGYAWWATGDDRFAEDFAFLLRDWIEDNPVPRILSNSRGERGTVWRTLETGIRGDVWFDAMELFLDAPQLDADALYLMTRSLVEQARHLHRYEVDFRYGNWQVVECAGLAAIGIMLPEVREAAGWRERAFEYLVEHMQRDVYPDGAHHELTPGYHSWVMHKFVKAARLAEINGYEVPGLLDRHEKMFEFIMHLAKPDGRYPALGDAGRGGHVAGHLGLGALMYGRSDMRFLGVERPEPSWVWLFGPEVFDRYARIEPRRPEFTSSMLPSAQYVMMRTGWEPGDRYLLFDCAPWGGGHSHQDRLQVILHAGERDLVIDPGIYSYDEPLARTYFRGAEAHNVLLIDGEGQPQSDPEVPAWGTTEVADFASGRIAEEGIGHQRSVLFVRPEYWVVVDHISGDGRHELTRQFHFPLIEVEANAHSARTAWPDGTNAAVVDAGDTDLQMREGWVPSGGAEAQRAPVAAFVAERALPTTFAAVLIPFEDAAELPEVERLASGDAPVVRLRVSFPDGQIDEVAISPEDTTLEAADETATGRALLVRSGPHGDEVYVHGGVQ